jgi:hypothetical protein
MNYNFIPGHPLVNGLFSAFCLFMILCILWAVHRSKGNVRKFSIVFFGFLLLFSGVVLSGMPIQRPLPVIPVLFAILLGSAVLFAVSDFGNKIGRHFSLAVLIGFQGFRFPLELILHHWASTETIPETMTWTGQNWDIIAGLLSLLAIPFLNRNKNIAWVVQMVGFVLLMNVLRVVIMSSPLQFAWPLERPILLIAYMPYALIGPLFVGVALSLHVITFRKLMGKLH